MHRFENCLDSRRFAAGLGKWAYLPSRGQINARQEALFAVIFYLALEMNLTGWSGSLYLGKTMYHATYCATAGTTMAMAMCMCSGVPVGCTEERQVD